MRTTKKGQGQPESGGKAPGAGTSTPNGKFSLISDEKLIGLYTNLLKCRAVERLSNGSLNGKSGSMRGRDTALVATSIDLIRGDFVCSPDRGLLTDLSNGNAIEVLITNSGGSGQPGISTRHEPAALNAVSSASFAHTVVGTALAYKTAKNGKIAVVYGDGTDALRETVHIASVHALPIIFVQHSNGPRRPRVSAHKTRRKEDSPEETPWFPVITVDTHDVVAVYRVANEAISRARIGRGPTVIECQPFLVNGKREKRDGHDASDPVLNMEHYLRAKGISIPG